MNTELLQQLRTAQQELDPQFKLLHNATGALQAAIKLAGEETLDALAMQKAANKLEQAAQPLTNQALQTATSTFASVTREILDSLAFAFARDLKHAFEQRGQTVEGRPPTLVVDDLVLNINIATRKAQWLYGKEELTNPIPLSINAILKAYDAQRKTILERKLESSFLTDVQKAWQQLVEEKLQASKARSNTNRANVVEVYSKVVLNRQSQRFWNAPSSKAFKDYARPLFVRDLVLAQANPTVTVNDKTYRLRLGVATKNNAESAMRSVWLPNGALDGEYYADVTFEEN